MTRIVLAAFAATLALASQASAQGSSAQGSPYDSIIASHAAANGVPAELVHRIIVRESRYRADAVGRGGATGLMQIKLATARGMGYTGTAAGLRDPDTNLRYGVRYLAGAYRAANGHHGRTVGYYASGYYYAAKRQRQRPLNILANARNETAMDIAAAGPAFDAQEPARKKARRR